MHCSGNFVFQDIVRKSGCGLSGVGVEEPSLKIQRTSRGVGWKDVETEHEGGPVKDRGPPQKIPPCHCGATDFADGSDTSVWFSVSVAVDR